MVVRRQGCGGARTAGQTTTTAAPASTPARLRPSPTPAAPRSLHHGDGRRQLLPSGRKQRGHNESSKSHVPAPHSHSHSHCQLELRSQATSRHTDRNTTAPVYLTGFWTFEETTRMRIGKAPILQAPPLRYCYWLRADPSLAVINASDYRQLEMKRKWLLGSCLYHRSKSFLP